MRGMSLQNRIVLLTYQSVWSVLPIFLRRIPRNSCQATLPMLCTLQDYLHPIALSLCHTLVVLIDYVLKE